MLKKYKTPVAEKVEFDYAIQTAASGLEPYSEDWMKKNCYTDDGIKINSAPSYI